jgi:hypothetical protein
LSSVKQTAQVAACPELLDHQADLVDMELPELLASLESLGSLVFLQHTASLLCLLHANRAHKDPLDHVDHLDPADPKDPVAHLVETATTVNPETRDHKDLLAQVAIQALADSLAALDPPPTPRPTPQETQEPKVLLDPRVKPDLLVPMDDLAAPVLADHEDLPALVAHKDLLVPMDALARMAHQDPKATAVSARNTAPWTAEFSSRMEPGDKSRIHLETVFVLLLYAKHFS